MTLYVTGYAFFRAAESEEQWRLAVLHRLLETLGGSHRIKDAGTYFVDTYKLPLEQRIERAVLNQRGGFLEFDLAGVSMTLRFPEWDQSPMRYFALECLAGEFRGFDPTIDPPDEAPVKGMERDPMRVEVFAQEWVRFCEAQGAYVAFFSNWVWFNSDDLIPYYLEDLEQNDILSIVKSSSWRTYLSPTAVKRFQEQLEQPWKGRSEQLPSGARVFAGRGYNPFWDDRDAPTNAHFLLQQIEPHTEVAGSEHLVGLLRQVAQRLQESKEMLARSEFDAYRAMLRQVRPRLDDVRATWACARLQKGLVGVQQEVTIRQEDGTTQQIYVPVIADQGHTWLVASLLYSFNLDEEAWSDPQSGLAVQTQRLLEAAKYQQSTGGTSPRVVVYFWRGVSEQVRQALLEMGVSVEVADHLPLLA